MSAEIQAILGLDESRFEQGLTRAARAQERFRQQTRAKPIELVPEKSARDSAKVFEEVDAARQQHVGALNRQRIESALATGAGAVGSSGKSAADSAAVFEAIFRAQEQGARDLKQAEGELAATRRRNAYTEANTVGRIKLVQSDLVALARQRNTQQAGTVDRLRTEQQIAEKLGALRGLQAAQRDANISVLPPLPVVEQRANGILAMLRRKFGADDASKDLLKGFGLGGVGGIAVTITEGFSMAADRAKSVAAFTGDMYQNLVRVLSVVGGPTRELALQRKEIQGINAEIGVQQNLIRDLESNPLTYLTPSGRASLMEAEQGLLDLRKRQSDISAQVDITTIAENRRSSAIQRQMQFENQLAAHERINAAEQLKLDLRKQFLQQEYNILKKEGALPSTLAENLRQQQAIETEKKAYAKALQERVEDIGRARRADDEMTAVELRNGSAVAKLLVRLNAARREYDTLRKRNAASDRLAENRREQDGIRGQIAVAQRDARRQLNRDTITLGAMLAGQSPGRLAQPRARGRSEAERIADRGQGYVRQAEEAARTGRSPEYVARLASLGSRDLRAAGSRVAAATSMVNPNDASALGSQLLEANKHLKEISDNLKPDGGTAGKK